MLRRLALATAIAIGCIVAAPVFAQDAASTSAPASQQSPEQIVQSIADQLANDIDGHRDELKRNQDKLINIIDEVFLPHFDIDYASILVLGQHAGKRRRNSASASPRRSTTRSPIVTPRACSITPVVASRCCRLAAISTTSAP